MAGLAAFGWLMLAAANLIFGELNQDEGWYLYAARLVREGQMPFRDFAFTQGPMMPLVYASAQSLVNAFGVGGGRAFTALLGLGSALAATALAARLAGPDRKEFAAWMAFILIGLNVYQSYFTTVVKTYALCALLLTTGFLLVAIARDSRSGVWSFIAGLVLAAAAATRITAGLSLAVIGLWMLMARESLGARVGLSFVIGGGLGLVLFLGVFFVLAPEPTRFFLVEYHAHRNPVGALGLWALKAGLVSRLVQAYFVAFSAGVGLVLLRGLGIIRAEGHRDGLIVAAWLTLAGIALVQAAAPFPYDDYQVPLYPLLAALLAAALFRAPALAAPRLAWATLLLAVLVNAASALSSPINQAWMVLGRDRIWWRMRERPALMQLQDVARRIRAESGESSELLTQDTYLAVEAGLRVPPGWEMGIFSYYPDWTHDRAQRMHVLNREMLRKDLLTSQARVAAMSDYGFSVAAPAVVPLPEAEQREWWALLESQFKPAGEIPYFGQGNTTLRLYTRAP